MNIYHLFSTRKGVGSILGGLFLILIFSSMIASLFLIENSGRLADEVYLERVKFDNEKIHEYLTYVNVDKKPNNYLNITVQNSGSVGTTIVYVGELIPKKSAVYHRLDLFLMPLEIEKDILTDVISVGENETKNITLVTSYGNQYFYHYDEQAGGPVFYDLTISISGIGTTSPSAGVHNYLEDTDVDVTAYAGYGYMLDHWMLDGSYAGNNNPFTVSMDEDHNLLAVFTESLITLIDDSFENLNNWESTNWQIETDEWHSADSSVKSSNGYEGDLQSIEMDTSNASLLSISFWYRLSGGVDGFDVGFMIYDGQGGPDTIDYLYGTEDTWILYEYNTTDTQYFIPDFYIRFDSNLRRNEVVWVDDLKVIMIP